MNAQEYQQYLNRTGHDEPAHLRVIPEYTRLRLARERKEAAARQQTARNTDEILNRVWADYDAKIIGGDDLQAIAYGYWFHQKFNFWPGSIPSALARRYGIVTRHDKFEPTSTSLVRLHEKAWRFLIPANAAGNRRSDAQSVFDYDPGVGHTFAEWVRRKSKNVGKDLDTQQRALELRSRQIAIQMREADEEDEDEWDTIRDGSVTTDEASWNGLPKPVLTEKDFADAPVPLELRRRFGRLRRKFADQHKHVAVHYLRGIWSAAEIERRLRARGIKEKPTGRKAIGRLIDAFESEQHQIAVGFLRGQEAYMPDDADEKERRHAAEQVTAEAHRLVDRWVASVSAAQARVQGAAV